MRQGINSLAYLVDDAEALGAAWRQSAACKGLDPAMFFPARGEAAAEAKALCATCPVREACLEYALVGGEAFGVWGGLSERQRKTIRARRRRREAA